MVPSRPSWFHPDSTVSSRFVRFHPASFVWFHPDWRVFERYAWFQPVLCWFHPVFTQVLTRYVFADSARYNSTFTLPSAKHHRLPSKTNLRRNFWTHLIRFQSQVLSHDSARFFIVILAPDSIKVFICRRFGAFHDRRGIAQPLDWKKHYLWTAITQSIFTVELPFEIWSINSSRPGLCNEWQLYLCNLVGCGAINHGS